MTNRSTHGLMLARLTAFAAFATFATLAAAQEPAAATKDDAISTQMVKLSRGESNYDCYLARPKGNEPAPGILLIHEWWGLSDWVKQQAERFARQGYVALAVDLYHGQIAADRDHAHELMRGLADDQAVADLKFAFEFLSGHKFTKGKPTGVIGWCMGGGYALQLAVADKRLACTVVCYGKPITDEAQLRRITGPILGIWGATDRGIDVASFKKALAKAGKDKSATHKIYPGAGHAFLNETNKQGYNKEQAEKAWAEIDAFLKRELKEEQP